MHLPSLRYLYLMWLFTCTITPYVIRAAFATAKLLVKYGAPLHKTTRRACRPCSLALPKGLGILYICTLLGLSCNQILIDRRYKPYKAFLPTDNGTLRKCTFLHPKPPLLQSPALRPHVWQLSPFQCPLHIHEQSAVFFPR